MARRIVIFANNDFTLRKAGSHQRMADLATLVEDNFGDGIVYGFHEHSEDPWDDAAAARFAVQYPRLTLVRDHNGSKLARFTKLKTVSLNLMPSRTADILRWHLPNATPNWDRIRRDAAHHLVIVHWVDGAAWLNGLPDGPFWVESHDVKFLKHAKRTGEKIHSASVSRRMRGEAAVLAASSGIVAISPVDHAILGALAPGVPNFYVPSHLGACEALASPAEPAFAHDLLFVGSGNAFNVQGLSDFIERNAAWLNTKAFAVAGSVSADPRVQAALAQVPAAAVLGFVDDLKPVYDASRVVISPVDGTGLKIKVIEALQHGKPVFGSRHSRDSLPPGFADCVFDLDPAAIDALLADEAKLAQAMAAARAYYRTIGAAGDREAFLAELRRQVES